jgi:hypothetical protein
MRGHAPFEFACAAAKAAERRNGRAGIDSGE